MYQNQPQLNPYNINFDIHPNYSGLRENVVKTILDIVQQGAATTPIRQWFYTIASANSWCNQQFKDTVEITFKYLIVMDIHNPAAKNNPNFIWDMCDGGIKLAISFIVQQFPNENNRFQQFHANNMQNLETLDKIIRDYNYIVSGGAQQPFGQPNQYMGNQVPVQGGFIPNNQPMYSGYQQNNQPMYGGAPQFPQNSYQEYQYPRSSPSLSNNQFQKPMNNQTMNPPSNHQVVSRFGNIELPPAPEPEPMPTPASYYPDHHRLEPTEVVIEPDFDFVSEKDWVSTPEQPYKTLCTSKQKAIYKRDRATGRVTEHIIERPEMERDRHAGKIRVCGLVIERKGQKERLARDVEAYCQITAEDIAERFAPKPRKDILETVKESVAEDSVQVSYLDAAITYGQIEHQNREQIDGANVFKMYATIAKPVVTHDAEDNETISKINECNDIPEVVKVLKEQSSKAVNEDKKVKSTLFCKEIDKTLANLINNFVLHSLSINTKIDSFVEDIYELIEILKSDHGPLYTDAMNRFKNEIFSKGPFANLPKDELDNIRNGLFAGIDKVEESDTTVSFIPSQYSITYVSSCSDELDMVIGKDSKIISELSLPILYGLAKTSHDHANGMPDRVMRHLLVTKDNKILEFHRGYLNEDTFLIREFTEQIDLPR